MAEMSVGDLPDGAKRCVVCAEPINAAALKCIHCSSEQSWLRNRLGVSSTVLSLLVALISVITAAVPVLKTALEGRNSRLVYSVKGASPLDISVLVANTGDRPGAVDRALLSIGEHSGQVVMTVDKEPNGIKIVQPGQSELVFFSSAQKFERDEKMGGKCQLVILGTDFYNRLDYSYEDRTDFCLQIDLFVAAHKSKS